MQENNSFSRDRFRLRNQTGAAAVEFAFVATIFFTLFFGVVEIARAMYISNTLQEVTRRAAELATNTDFTRDNAIQNIREAAIFRTSPGLLAFAESVSDARIKIHYMSISRDGGALAVAPIPTGSLPSSPLNNQEICMSDPNDARCIRLVRVRVCQPGGGNQCDPVPYQLLVSLIPIPFPLPISTTVSLAETLGRPAGLPP
jgi:Flp pilus assembly pilin Flp